MIVRLALAGPSTTSVACWARMLGTWVSSSKASKWVLTKRNFFTTFFLPLPFWTLASTEVQPRVTGTSMPEMFGVNRVE